MKNNNPDLEKIKEWTDKLLTTTHRLATGPNDTKSPPMFPRLVEAIYRRDYTTLSTIRYLSEGEQFKIITFGSSCMDLSRRILEDVISLEYMRLKDKNSAAQKFWDYLKVQDKLDLDYLSAVGISIEPEKIKLIENAFDLVKKDFQVKSKKTRWNAWKESAEYLLSLGHQIDMKKLEEEFDRRYKTNNESIRKNWSGMDVETMIAELVKVGKFAGKDETRSLMRGYGMGNDKNHTSPRDLINYLDNADYEKRGAQDMNLALLTATIYTTKLAGIFIEEFDITGQIADDVEELWETLSTAHLLKGDDKNASS